MPLLGLTVPWWIKYLIVPAVGLFIPWLGALLSAIIKIIESIPDPVERKAAIEELKAAAHVYKATGNVGPLAALAKRIHKKHCEGVACASDLKSE